MFIFFKPFFFVWRFFPNRFFFQTFFFVFSNSRLRASQACGESVQHREDCLAGACRLELALIQLSFFGGVDASSHPEDHVTTLTLQNSRCPCHPFCTMLPIHILQAFWLKSLTSNCCMQTTAANACTNKSKKSFNIFNAPGGLLRITGITLTDRAIHSTMARRKAMAGRRLFSSAIPAIKREAARNCASIF